MYLTPTADHWACDIEADNFLDKATKIHCACLINLTTKEEVDCLTADDFTAFTKSHPAAVFVGHNFLTYDGPMLNRFWSARLSAKNVVDTYVLSQLYSPGLKGGHRLQSWGHRLGYPKAESPDFATFTPEMLKYCRRDTRLAGLLFIRLTERMRTVGFSEKGASLEHLAWDIIQNRQVRNGFPFDLEKAEKIYAEIRHLEEKYREQIHRLWPPVLTKIKTFAKSAKADGTPTANYLRHRGQYPRVEENPDGSYDVYDNVAFNLGSPQQRIEKLLSLGWKPTKFTKVTKKGGGGNPQVDEERLVAFAETSGQPEVAALSKWIVLNSRANNIKTWMDAYRPDTKAIHGRLLLASTLRYRHNNPNSANIPAVRTAKDADGVEHPLLGLDGYYTYECRDVWWSGSEDEDLVGIDGKGIQLRVLAHNVAKIVGVDEAKDFITNVLSGDPHTNNIKILGLANKPAAKKFLYTTLMGGGGAKLAADQAQFGTTLTTADGNRLKDMLISSVPGFKELIRKLTKELEDTGRITLCDGSRILVSSPHMVIPYLLQGDESRLMKQALIYTEAEISRNGWRAAVKKVADIHDEWQYRSAKAVSDAFVEASLRTFPAAGDTFGYLIPIEGDAKKGQTWARTH